jgi:uncharacterized protein
MRRKEREITDSEEIADIISRADVCHLAFSDNNSPYIIAMNFGFIDAKPPLIYFHCANEGRKIEILKRNNRVAFMFDTDHQLVNGTRACDFSMKYSSVAGTGEIYIVKSEEEREEGLNIIMKHYSGKGDFKFDPSTMNRTTILKLVASSITGKKTG